MNQREWAFSLSGRRVGGCNLYFKVDYYVRIYYFCEESKTATSNS